MSTVGHEMLTVRKRLVFFFVKRPITFKVESVDELLVIIFDADHFSFELNNKYLINYFLHAHDLSNKIYGGKLCLGAFAFTLSLITNGDFYI